jgi:cell division protein FtsI/penicillin-binding protein 2
MHDKHIQKISEDQEIRSKDRIDFVLLIWLAIAIVIIFRAFYIQVVKHSYYTDLANKQYISKTAVNFDRGTIYFSQFKGVPVPAAQLRTTYRIAIDPTQIIDKESTYTKINAIVPLDKAEFLAKAGKQDDPYEEIAKDVNADDVAFLKSKKIKGLSFVKDNKRSYPQDAVGAKIIGFVGNDGTAIKGQYGLERYYDDVLTRQSDDVSVNFFAELFTDIRRTIVSNSDTRQGDIILTLDAEAQRVLQQVLSETKEAWGSDTIGGIIMDPQTGRIIAMDALPTFNPNDYSQVKDANAFLNQNVSGVYEMGSIIKPITMAAALDANVVTEATTYNDTGFRDLNGYKVRNFDGKPRGPGTTMQTILDKSLNVGIVFLVEQLGPKKFQEYFKKFGIGSETGIDLPTEASGLTKNLDSNVLVDSAESLRRRGPRE